MPEATGLGATPSEESEESSHSVAARVGRWA